MTKRILFTNEEGGVSIVCPSPIILKTKTIEEIASKDVPAGAEYWIVDTDTVSSDRTFRNAWKLDNEVGSGDGVGNTSNKWD